MISENKLYILDALSDYLVYAKINYAYVIYMSMCMMSFRLHQ